MEGAVHRRAVAGVIAMVLFAVSACALAIDLPDSGGAESTLPTVPVPDTTVDELDTTVDTAAGSSSTTTTTTTTLPPLEPATFESLSRVTTIRSFTSSYGARGMARWTRSVPGIEDIRIVSTTDGAEQPALWLAPRGDRDRPLLVVLHSWSSPYLQHAGIPFAMWAQENGWAVIAPNFRGVNNHPDAMGSDLAVQDVIDAIDHAIAQDGVDPDRVYAVGYSGGGMMSLLLAGRHPDRVTAVAAWGPVHDLVDFYRQSRGRSYGTHIWRGCGGNPTVDDQAREECLRRSPATYLDSAREQGVPVYIGQGINDWLLTPSHAARAFNQLADPQDRLTDDEVDAIGRRRIPEHLTGEIAADHHFGERDPAVAFSRQSGSVWLVLFRAGHEMVYTPTLRWFASDPR